MAGMPSSRRLRDPYRTPSPEPAPPRVRRKTGTIEDYGFTATKSVNSYRRRMSPKNAMATAEPGQSSPVLESEFSSPGSVPSLSTTPNSVRSSEYIATPKKQGGIHLFSKEVESESQWESELHTSRVWKRSIAACQNTIALSSEAIQTRHIPQPIDEIDHPESLRHNVDQTIVIPATPKRQVIRPYDSQTCSLARFRSQYRRHPLSMWSIVACVVLLQRYIKGRSNRQGKLSRYGEKAVVSQATLRAIPSPVPSSKISEINPWLLQIENSNSCSDSDAVESLAGDATEDDSEAGGFMWCGKGVDTHTIHWERRVALEDIMELAQHALSHLPPETMTKVLGDVRTLFDSRPSQLASSGNCSTSSSFDFSQPEGNYESTVPIRRGQKRSLDEGDEQLPNNEDNNPRKRQNLHGTLDAESRPMWACPFYKREPHRYCDKTELGDFRKCARSPGFPEVHRVKGHLQKCHSSPIYCNRCYTVVNDNKELENHQRRTPACDVKPPSRIEGLTSEQKKLLQPRDRGRSEEERWKAMYKICFPDDEVVPSPYYVHHSREFAELRRDVLGIIRAEAQSVGNFDLARLLQNVEGAFNAQRSTHAEPPGIRTPSTSDSSHSSNTSEGSSNQATAREMCQRTPSVTRTTRQLASVTGCGETLQVPYIDEVDERSDSTMGVDGTPTLPYVSQFPESDNFASFDQPDESAPVYFRGFAAPVPQLDFGQHQIDQEYADLDDFNFPQQDLDSMLNL